MYALSPAYSGLLSSHTCPSAGHGAVGTLWFAIWLQGALIAGVFYTLASDSIAMHRFQIATFGAVALVFAVGGADRGLFSAAASELALGVGWLLLALVDVLWVLYFTSEDGSLALHVFNSMGTGGLTPPSRRRRTRGPSIAIGAGGNEYAAPYAPSTGGYEPGAGIAGPPMSGPVSSAGGDARARSFVGSADGRSMRSMTRPTSDVSNPMMHSPNYAPGDIGPGSPLMGGGNAGVGAGGGPSLGGSAAGTEVNPASAEQQPAVYQAKALYACQRPSPHAYTVQDADGSQTPRPPRTRTKSASRKARSSRSWTRWASGGRPRSRTARSAVRASFVPSLGFCMLTHCTVAPSNYLQII
jgi:SHO1 osmosensor